MNLDEKLVKRFQIVFLEHFKEMLNYATAESELKELAEMIRLTSESLEKK